MKAQFLSVIVIIAAVIGMTSCEQEHGPSINDHFLNYKIPNVPVTEDYVVGVAYNYTVSSYGDTRYKDLFAKTPVLGEYSNIKNMVQGKAVVDQHLEWLNQAD